MAMTWEELENSDSTYTVAEFLELELPETDEEGHVIEYELVKGEILSKHAETESEHGEVLSRLNFELRNFVSENPDESLRGRIFVRCSCNFNAETTVIADLAFVKKERLPNRIIGPILIAPDLVVEVNSATDILYNIYTKIQAYQSARVRLIWSINLAEKYIRVYDVTKPKVQTLEIDDVLEGGSVLSGFKLPVARLFE